MQAATACRAEHVEPSAARSLGSSRLQIFSAVSESSVAPPGVVHPECTFDTGRSMFPSASNTAARRAMTASPSARLARVDAHHTAGEVCPKLNAKRTPLVVTVTWTLLTHVLYTNTPNHAVSTRPPRDSSRARMQIRGSLLLARPSKIPMHLPPEQQLPHQHHRRDSRGAQWPISPESGVAATRQPQIGWRGPRGQCR